MSTKTIAGTPNDPNQDLAIQTDQDCTLDDFVRAVHVTAPGVTVKLPPNPKVDQTHRILAIAGLVLVNGNGHPVLDGGAAVLDQTFSTYTFSASNSWVPEAGSEVGPVPLPITTQEVYVNKGGSDVTGNGSFFRPFLTIAAAMASITDNAIGKRYDVNVGPGNYADPFGIKPWVAVTGNPNTSGFFGITEITAPADTCGFEPGVWGPAGFAVAWYSNLVFSNHQTWDEIAAGTNEAQLTYFNCDFNGGATYNGPASSGVDNITWNNCLSYGGATVKGWQFFFTIGGTQFLGGTVTIDAGPAGALSDTTWLAQNTSVGSMFSPTAVVFHWAAPSPVGVKAAGDFAHSSITGGMTLDGVHTSFVDRIGAPVGTTTRLNGAGGTKGTIVGNHITSSGAIPSAALGAASGGAGAQVLMGTNSTDNAGTVLGTMGVAPGTGSIFEVTFQQPYPHPPAVVLTRGDSNDVGQYYVTTTSAGFKINASIAPLPNTSLIMNYIVVGVDAS